MNTANTDLKQAQDKTQKLSDQLSSVNTITLPSGYSDALKAYFNYHCQSNWSESVDNSLSKVVAKYRDTAFNENNFKNNKTDEQRIVDRYNEDNWNFIEYYAGGHPHDE